MAEKTKIGWCDATLNAWWGCTKVSDGCKFCYAENLSDQRFGKGAWGPGGRRQEVKGWRDQLRKISKRAKSEGRRLKVFCSSMCDVFEGPETMGGADSENWKLVSRLREELLKAVSNHPELDFLFLTKRPENVMLWGPTMAEWVREGFPDNVWFGTSIEDQPTAEKRIPHLLKIRAKVLYLSYEPAIGPVDLTRLSWVPDHTYNRGTLNALTGKASAKDPKFMEWDDFSFGAVSWVICGGESGRNARPMHPDWARGLRDQCQQAGVPFFFKQWGEWLPWDHFNCALDGGIDDELVYSRYDCAIWDDHKYAWDFRHPSEDELGFDEMIVGKVGKARAGRLLDGCEWNEFPEVPS